MTPEQYIFASIVVAFAGGAITFGHLNNNKVATFIGCGLLFITGFVVMVNIITPSKTAIAFADSMKGEVRVENGIITSNSGATVITPTDTTINGVKVVWPNTGKDQNHVYAELAR